MTERALTATALDLRQVKAGETPLHRTFAPADIEGGADGLKVTAPVELDGLFVAQDPRYRLKGRIRTTLELPCGRCLEPFAFDVDAPFDLSFVPQPSGAAAPDVELSEDDLSTAYYQDRILDLGETIREQLHLALPIRPLCRDDCRGLCQRCGANRNLQDCGCEVRWEDPRMSRLRDMFERKD